MRDLINIVTNLTESRGLGARKAGEEFVSVTNPDDKIYVDSVTFYPQEGSAYASYEEMAQALRDIATNIPNANVDLIGKFKQTDLAFGIAIFRRADPNELRLAFVKPYKAIKGDPTQNQWDNQTGIPGYRYNSKAAAKTQAGMTPQDVLTQPSDLRPQEIVDQIAAKFGADSVLTQVAHAVASGKSLPLTIPAQPGLSFTAFRDYFCELLHPIALQTGNYKGNAGDAAAKFLEGVGFAGCTINFGNDKTEGLSDSILIAPDGRKIKVSSKGAKGAEASAKNLADAVKELQDSNPAMVKKHQDVINMVEEMVQAGQGGAPLKLGVRFGIIDEDDANDIIKFRKLPRLYTLNDALEFMSPKLGKLARARATNDPDNVNVYFHAMAAVAHKVAEHVNQTTNFSQAASEILNNGALVQVYTKATEGLNGWTLNSFDTVWPSNTVTGVAFSAGKTYYSTGIKGNFTFKILRNGAKDVPDETGDIDQMAAKQTAAKPKAAGASMSADRAKRPGALKFADSGKTDNIGRSTR